MKQLEIAALSKAIHALGALGDLLRNMQAAHPNTSFACPEQNYQEILAHLTEVERLLPDLNSGPASRTLEIVKQVLTTEWSPNPVEIPGMGTSMQLEHLAVGRIANFTYTLRQNFWDALYDSKLYIVDSRNHKYLRDPADQFDARVVAQFPSIHGEFSSAGRCLAYSEPTAAVFHLLRALERALQAVCLSMGLPVTNAGKGANWNSLLQSIHAEMSRRNKIGASAWSNLTAAFVSQVHASVDGIRVAWRNPTMHVENTYTQLEAEHIYGLIGGLLALIAGRIDENGVPPA